MRLVVLQLGEIIWVDLNHMFDWVVIHLSKGFKFNLINLCSITSSFFDKFGSGFHCSCLICMAGCMLIQKFVSVIHFCWTEAKLALRFSVDALVVGVLCCSCNQNQIHLDCSSCCSSCCHCSWASGMMFW